MKWIAYFLVLFFIFGCDNSQSKEDLELIKEQTNILNGFGHHKVLQNEQSTFQNHKL